MNDLCIKKSNIVLLLLDYLKQEGYEGSYISLEKESGITLYDYPKEIIFLRSLILNGQWKDVEEFIAPMSEILGEISFRSCMFEIKKQVFIEIVEKENSRVEDLVMMLNEIQLLAPNQESFNQLVKFLSQSNSDEEVDFEISSSRLKCFEKIRELLIDLFPTLDKERKLANNTFVSLLNGISLDKISSDNKSIFEHSTQHVQYKNNSEQSKNELFLINDINIKEDNTDKLAKNEILTQSLKFNNISDLTGFKNQVPHNNHVKSMEEEDFTKYKNKLKEFNEESKDNTDKFEETHSNKEKINSGNLEFNINKINNIDNTLERNFNNTEEDFREMDKTKPMYNADIYEDSNKMVFLENSDNFNNIDNQIDFNDRVEEDEDLMDNMDNESNNEDKEQDENDNDENKDEEVNERDLIKNFIEENELLKSTTNDMGFEDKENGNELDDLDKEEHFFRSNYEIFNYSVEAFYAKVRINDKKPIRCSCISPNKGDYMAIGTNLSSVKIFDIKAVTYQFDQVNTYRYSNNSLSNINSNSNNNNEPKKKEVTQVKEIDKHHNGSIYCMDWSCSGRLIATGSNDQLVKCLVVPSLEYDDPEEARLELSMRGHKGIVRSICFDPTEELILLSAGQKEAIIRVWDPEEGVVKMTLEGHSCDVNVIKWSNDNQLCASSGDDKTIRFWDVRTNKNISLISALKHEKINDISIYTKSKSVSLLFLI